jgi:hypothetical protein
MILSLSRSQFAKACSLVVVLACAEGCGASLAQPFDKMEKAPMTAFRLQNFEPPPQATASAPTGIQLPPQIQQWMSAGASLLPPGLLPPGLLPGTAAPTVAPQENVPRFHNFRILGSMNINPGSSMHDEVIKIFGVEKEFEQPRESCMYAEFGFSIAQINQPPADILVSLTCNQVQTFGFAWPHGAKTGLTPDASKRIVEVMKKTFGG